MEGGKGRGGKRGGPPGGFGGGMKPSSPHEFVVLALDRATAGGVFLGGEREDLERSALMAAALCRIFDRTSWIEGARKRNIHRHERNRTDVPRLHAPHS